MTVTKFPFHPLEWNLTPLFLGAAIAISLTWLGGGSVPSVKAETGGVVLEVPVYRQTTQGDLVTQAEAMAHSEIARQFNQNPGLAVVQLSVVGNRNGDIVPILSATVSRSQWQENPQVSAWSQYYASQSLFQRHDALEAAAVAAATTTAPVSVASSPARRAPRSAESPQRAVGRDRAAERAAEIDRAFDEGRLTGSAAQQYLSDLD